MAGKALDQAIIHANAILMAGKALDQAIIHANAILMAGKVHNKIPSTKMPKP